MIVLNTVLKWFKNTVPLVKVNFLLILLLMLTGREIYALPKPYEVPAQISFCGIELTLTPGVRQEILKTVVKLTHNEEYLKTLQSRIDVFMPWVEEALKKSGMPEDLKYLVIQESAFIGDAVSTSHAVGFWQFKDFTAREMGLTVNDQVDERKHIYRSTLAAARYFYQNNRIFDNYLYAVIAYYAGGGGSMAHIDPDKFGAKKMTLQADFHWYPLKAIAHKIVFESYISSGGRPSVWLESQWVSGTKDLHMLSAEFNVPSDSLKKYNLWMLQNRIPGSGKPYLLFIPRKPAGSPQTLQITSEIIPVLKPGFAGPEIAIPELIPPIYSGKNSNPKMYSHILWDQDFRDAYVYSTEQQSLEVLAALQGISVENFRKWNPILTSQNTQSESGTWYLTTPPDKLKYWVVKQGETWAYISEVTGISETKLLALNRESRKNIYPESGRKLQLRKRLKKNEKYLVLQETEKMKKSEYPVLQIQSDDALILSKDLNHQPVICKPEGKSVLCKVVIPEEIRPFPLIKSQWLIHEVQKGEEVWMLAKKYDTRGDLIKKVNQLSTARIRPGMKLKVFFVESL